MSEVAILAIITPAKGKYERFIEVSKDCIDWIKANEKETLQFEMYETAAGEEGAKKVLFFEKYASQAAKDRHESTENYKKFFENVMAEELLAEPPLIMNGGSVAGYRR